MHPLLDVRDLETSFFTETGRIKAVDKISFELDKGETLALVGESGCGKSVTALSLLRLVPEPGRIVGGRILFSGEEILTLPEEGMRRIRGNRIGMIFQEPMTALNPVMTIGNQIDEVFRFHEKMPGKERRRRALGLLEDVQLPDPEQALKAYPHELSGGQRQRAMIAMALALDPKILIADEPTTALDVTTQAQVLKLIKEMQATHGTGVLFITHDFGVVADIADRVAVMQNGIVVETGTTYQVLRAPTHPYTQALIGAVPDLIPRPARPRSSEIVLQVNSLEKTYTSGGGLFGGKGRVVHAANDVTFDLARGETLGIVGESGSGKSTVARCIVRLNDAEAGEILLGDTDLRPLGRAAMRPHRSKIQMVFQDPYASLNPRRTVAEIVGLPLQLHGLATTRAELRDKVGAIIERVGLKTNQLDRYPHQFSGGQRQRIGIARALYKAADVLVFDEASSALDTDTETAVMEAVEGLDPSLTLFIIAHRVQTLRKCDLIIRLEAGRVVATGSYEEVIESPVKYRAASAAD